YGFVRAATWSTFPDGEMRSKRPRPFSTSNSDPLGSTSIEVGQTNESGAGAAAADAGSIAATPITPNAGRLMHATTKSAPDRWRTGSGPGQGVPAGGALWRWRCLERRIRLARRRGLHLDPGAVAQCELGARVEQLLVFLACADHEDCA